MRLAPSLLPFGALLTIGGTAPLSAATTLPQIIPQPTQMELTGGELKVSRSATIAVMGPDDPETLRLARAALTALGVKRTRVVDRIPTTAKETLVVLGTLASPAVTEALARSGSPAPTKAEGYTIASIARTVNSTLIILAGKDADGLYYAAQTLHQAAKRGTLPALRIFDEPRMAVRGVIEGFYGAPWSMHDRLAHIAFLGSVKGNTYIYSPKDDPYARDRWRVPYPANTLAQLGELVTVARSHHVRFTYAISPGLSICYSNPDDLAALKRKFATFAALGVRSFYIAFDDITYDKWNCEADHTALGKPGEAAAGEAQAHLAGIMMDWLVGQYGPQAQLMIVPTEYYNATDSPYKGALRALDPRVRVQRTGPDVVPAAIGLRDAKAAQQAFGRKPLLWDNYPVNDYAKSSGRLLLAPYDRREPGLADELDGVLANPMNQEAPNRIGVSGSAAFAWNDRHYDPRATALWAARELAGGDAATTRALLLLFDLEHLAPTFGGAPWQPQSPQLARTLGVVTDAIANAPPSDREIRLRELATLANRITAAPQQIRAGVQDAGFLAQTAPWLDAMEHWGKALRASTNGIIAALADDPSARAHFDAAAHDVATAKAATTIPGTTRPQGPIRMGDGVLDRFIDAAPHLVWSPALVSSAALQN
ncbi:beta-N-acetylhexosaminidase family protein [Novosphingobium guangzhouense]|uniref:beta-N-acetylhexosaminidase family protein n=1 Tax=Novosphingobium guangzhouense TaxID=1850347 RepID=UPI001B801E37|nr:beta-N-acetylglucosaminidase domain-containing protein [Novosphingobium guangzhouense]